MWRKGLHQGVTVKLGSNFEEVFEAFQRVDCENCGHRITEASIVGSNLRFRLQGSGKLGVVVGAIGLRDATKAELVEFEESVELGQVEIYTTPLYVSGRSMPRAVLHQATGYPLNPASAAARRQRERWAQAEARAARRST